MTIRTDRRRSNAMTRRARRPDAGARGAPLPDAGARSARPPDVAAIESRLARALDRSEIRLTAARRHALAGYVALLAKWNRVYNLTAVRDPFEMIGRHVLDSLTALDFLSGARLLDAGAGAGLPGLVLAIVRPDVRCTLLDPVRKKTRFCAHAAMALGLDNVEIASERLAAHRPPHRYSTVVSRAAFSVADLVAGALPILDTPGRIIAMKGPDPEAEIDSLDRGGLDVRVVHLDPPGDAGDGRAGAGAGRRATTLVLVERAGRGVGATGRQDAESARHAMPARGSRKVATR